MQNQSDYQPPDYENEQPVVVEYDDDELEPEKSDIESYDDDEEVNSNDFKSMNKRKTK